MFASLLSHLLEVSRSPDPLFCLPGLRDVVARKRSSSTFRCICVYALDTSFNSRGNFLFSSSPPFFSDHRSLFLSFLFSVVVSLFLFFPSPCSAFSFVLPAWFLTAPEHHRRHNRYQRGGGYNMYGAPPQNMNMGMPPPPPNMNMGRPPPLPPSLGGSQPPPPPPPGATGAPPGRAEGGGEAGAANGGGLPREQQNRQDSNGPGGQGRGPPPPPPPQREMGAGGAGGGGWPAPGL